MVLKHLIYLNLWWLVHLDTLQFVNCSFLSVGAGWAWSTMAKGTAAGMKQQWEAWWLLWCRRPSIDTTGPCAADRSWRDTSSEFVFEQQSGWALNTCRRGTVLISSKKSQISDLSMTIFDYFSSGKRWQSCSLNQWSWNMYVTVWLKSHRYCWQNHSLI